MKRSIKINQLDNTGTCFDGIEAGEKVSIITPSGQVVQEVTARQTIPFGHKIALAAIGKRDRVLKYGEVIGIATAPISLGDYVHIHNVESAIVPGAK